MTLQTATRALQPGDSLDGFVVERVLHAGAMARIYVVHFANGFVFALCYYAVFRAVGHAGWLFGALLGLVHAALAGGVLMTVLLPAIHPRMGTPWSDAEDTPLLESPGFLLMNYGSRTVIFTVLGHIAYGAIVGGFTAHLR